MVKGKFLNTLFAGLLIFGLQTANSEAAEQTVTKNGEYVSIAINGDNFTGCPNGKSVRSA